MSELAAKRTLLTWQVKLCIVLALIRWRFDETKYHGTFERTWIIVCELRSVCVWYTT